MHSICCLLKLLCSVSVDLGKCSKKHWQETGVIAPVFFKDNKSEVIKWKEAHR